MEKHIATTFLILRYIFFIPSRAYRTLFLPRACKHANKMPDKRGHGQKIEKTAISSGGDIMTAGEKLFCDGIQSDNSTDLGGHICYVLFLNKFPFIEGGHSLAIASQIFIFYIF